MISPVIGPVHIHTRSGVRTLKARLLAGHIQPICYQMLPKSFFYRKRTHSGTKGQRGRARNAIHKREARVRPQRSCIALRGLPRWSACYSCVTDPPVLHVAPFANTRAGALCNVKTTWLKYRAWKTLSNFAVPIFAPPFHFRSKRLSKKAKYVTKAGNVF